MRGCTNRPGAATVLLTTLAVVLGAAAPTRLVAAPPQVESTVTIHRDPWGVPHVYGDSEEAAYYGLGYATAEDRLEILLGGILWAQGRRAEILGDGELAADVEMRRWRHWEMATAGFARLSPQLRRNYTAFAEGVQRYMADSPQRAPAWAPEVIPQAFVALSRAMYWFGYNGRLGPAECAKGGAQLQEGRRESDDAATRLGASNGWLVMGSRTADGSTILLADPHVSMNNPLYYEYRLHSPTLESSGFAAGPLLWQAYNRHVGWATTTGSPDLWDCYAVEVDAADPRRFLFDGRPQQMEVRKETLRSASGKVIEREFEYTHHNGVLSPVVARQGRIAYVVSASQMNDAGLLDDEMYRMNKAASVAEVRKAMRSLGMYPQNILVADDRGEAWYVRAGKTPRRPPGYDWSGPVPGNTSATAWRGMHPLADLVQVLDPPEGYLQNDNVAPDRMFPSGRPGAGDYPAYLFNDRPGRSTTRGERTIAVLSKASRFTVDDAKDLAFDETWASTATWQDALRLAVDRHPQQVAALFTDERTMLERILHFDGRARAESPAALNFYFWRMAAGEWLQSEPSLAALRTYPWDRSTFAYSFTLGLLEKLAEGRRRQVAAVGSIDAPLGQWFRAGHGSQSLPLGGVTIDVVPAAKSYSPEDCTTQVVPACDVTLRAFDFAPPNEHNERFAVSGSQAMRLMVFGKHSRSWTLYAYGEQLTPGKPHGDDQLELFSRREMKPSLFDLADLRPQIRKTTTLTFGRRPLTIEQ
jgi:acyl-homoserine-lactone acylase